MRGKPDGKNPCISAHKKKIIIQFFFKKCLITLPICYRKSKATDAIIKEVQKRRTQEIDSEGSLLKFCDVFAIFCAWKFCFKQFDSLPKDTPLHKKWSFPLWVSSVNLTKSTGNCGFGHFYWRNLDGKLHFLCSTQDC